MLIVKYHLGFFTALLCTFVIGGCSPSSDVAKKSEDKNAVADQSDRLIPPDEQMRQAMQAQDWKRADEFMPRALIAGQDDPNLLTDAAKVAALNGRKREAAELLVQAAQAANYQPASRVDFAIQGLIDVGELYAAIDLLQQDLIANPENLKHRKNLIGFLGEAERPELAQPHLQHLIKRRAFDVPLLLAVTETSSRRYSFNTSNILMQRNPNDYRVRLGDAKELIDKHDALECETLLREILDHHPDFAPAYAMLGQALMEQHDVSAIPDWASQAPEGTDQQPAYWLTIGDWAMANDEYLAAVRSYWQATRIDPNDSNAWIRLTGVLQRIQRTNLTNQAELADTKIDNVISDELIQAVDDRIELLLKLRAVYYDFTWDGKDSQTDAFNIAKVLFSLGRTWEAEAWSAIATTLKRDPEKQLPDLRLAILKRLKQDPSWITTIEQPALAADLSSLPLANLEDGQRERTPTQVPLVRTHQHVVLADETEARGLAGFGGKNNPDDAKLAPLIRSTGVGGGTIDFDRDGWHDLLIMGAGGTMLKTDSMPNELLRNLNGSFDAVTTQAGVGDRGYGQGAAVGDFNEDGFPDLFFANLGKNRLLRNNGDGTFTDCTALLDDNDWQEWSTCGAFVDLNHDGRSDLMTTNYCRTIKDMDKACPDDQGVPGPCHPLKFPAHRDQFFLMSDHGVLQDRSEELIADVMPGRGLGIVAGTLDGNHVSAFVANDMTPNAYYTAVENEPQLLIESGAASGLAVDGRTIAQASMGVASSDFDGDGDLDFYVTGFGREYNILYDQVAPGLWQDITNQLGLVRPTLQLVGFGTQAIDFDDDGLDELIVTNGHIGDFNEPESLPYAQPMQVFRRGEKGRFDLIQDDAWGEYFRQSHVGRALWTLDADRDGRRDVVVTHSYEPICLLVNQTAKENHHVTFRLVGSEASRDAIGAMVRFRCNGQPRTLWALSGSGYFCSNDPELRAGLGNATEVSDVMVTWPDGSTESLGTLAGDQEYLIVQGDPTAFVLQ
ncbi:FG-GAP-like repeat-containing protein [Stieleria sp. JC731]|uniref:FG-GAP-like repeat-containing protein n=1 Tax=Pirellulaceae TaxID=2691357 RepID=UPI001E3609AB|nr:FG-GAP-like repeat-containing protein [Stieleria sp. JC731]MCC9604136.1 FG-GAP-like repeat-containing protein [Stieleria sp. JC731]